MRASRTLSAFAIFSVAVFGAPVFAQVAGDNNPNQTMSIAVGAGDKQASVKGGVKQIQTPAAGVGMQRVQRALALEQDASRAAHKQDLDGVPSPGFYPGDLSYDSHEGAVITDMVGHPIYVNTDPGTVGYPGTLLNDLGKSELIHVVDQYVGISDDNRYKAGVGGLLTYKTTTKAPLVDGTDITAIVHAAAVAFNKTSVSIQPARRVTRRTTAPHLRSVPITVRLCFLMWERYFTR
jgi:hypothetical protein